MCSMNRSPFPKIRRVAVHHGCRQLNSFFIVDSDERLRVDYRPIR